MKNRLNYWILISITLSSILGFVLAKQIINNQAILDTLSIATEKCVYGRVTATKKGREIIFRCDESPTAVTDEYLSLINSEREKVSLPLMTRNIILEQSAQLKACDMFNNNYFDHISKNGLPISWWANAAGYNYKVFGENIAHNTGNTEMTHASFMNSDTHRKLILDKEFNEVGVSKCGPYIVEHFGLKK